MALAEVETISKDGLYDIEASLTIDEKDLKSPATFECILRIPETNYTVKKSTVYYTGRLFLTNYTNSFSFPFSAN
ncbi:hypothetical protein O3M35_013214 [Rhynocoris fuscipes]|uniref:Uncharacterized protein n=1 Tax=Rhynocoris fuscipes TaxID=488301 RepID=A0AAW1CGT5_9HEMI